MTKKPGSKLKVFVAVGLAVMVLGGATLALAATGDDAAATPSPKAQQSAGQNGAAKTQDDGKIQQNGGNSATTQDGKAGRVFGSEANLLDEMVQDGVIDQATADKISAYVEKKMEERMADRQTSMWDALVEKGAIDQAAADKISAYMKEKRTEMQAEREKVQGMTEEEREAYFEDRQGRKTDILAELVEKGILTQEQADAIKSLMQQRDRDDDDDREDGGGAAAVTRPGNSGTEASAPAADQQGAQQNSSDKTQQNSSGKTQQGGSAQSAHKPAA